MQTLQEQLDALRALRDEARDAALALAANEDTDLENDEDFTALQERAVNLDGRIERIAAMIEQQNAARSLDTRLTITERETREADQGRTPSDLGYAYINSEEYRSWGGRGNSPRFEWQGPQERALPMTLTTFGDVLSLGANRTEDVTPPRPAARFLPLLNVIPVSTNSVDYVTYEKVNGAAGVVAEGSVKPSIEWKATSASASLATIAGYTQFTRQLAEDSAAVRAFINGELAAEVLAAVEKEAADAVADAIPALAGVNAPAQSGVLGAVRAGKGAVATAGYTPNGFLVRESDLIALDIEVMERTGSAPNETTRYWGLAPIAVPDDYLDEGETVVGDFRRGVTHYSRNSVQLYFTDSHAETFTYNILTALAETRALTRVVRPGALVLAGENVTS